MGLTDWVIQPDFAASMTHYNAQQQWRNKKIRQASGKDSQYENKRAFRDYL